jgi:hypothetical protein
MRLFSLVIAIAVLSRAASSQPAPDGPDTDFVQRAFGKSCSLEPNAPFATGDLNGDGVEDLAVVARCKNPLIDQDEYNFRVIDPYYSFYGYGNPRVTSQIGQDDPRMKSVVLLVIHGDGPDAWRSQAPKAKFLIINLPVKQIAVKKMRLKKRKTGTAIYVEESGGDQMTSAIFWDGKKYRYEPLGSSME